MSLLNRTNALIALTEIVELSNSFDLTLSINSNGYTLSGDSDDFEPISGADSIELLDNVLGGLSLKEFKEGLI